MNLLFALVFTFAGLPQQPAQAPTTPRDSTIHVISDVGSAVADLRADLDHFRMLLVTDSLASGSHAQGAAALRHSCENLARVAAAGRRIMCPRCMAALQASMNRYRDYLPALAALGRRCAARIERIDVGASPIRARRQLAFDLSATIVEGLRPYEQRLGGVIQAMQRPSGPAQGTAGRKRGT